MRSMRQQGKNLPWFQLIVAHCAELLLHTSGSVDAVRAADEYRASMLSAEL